MPTPQMPPMPAAPPPPPNPPMYGAQAKKSKGGQAQGYAGTILGGGLDRQTQVSGKTLLGQ